MTTPPRGLVIVNAFPLLAQSQGDEGNARVLAHRAGLRGIPAEIITHHAGRLPAADVYLVGGMEEETQPELAARLRTSDLAAAVADGAVVLAVDAGYQVLGHRYATAEGTTHDGLGRLDVVSTWSDTEANGPVITRPSEAYGLPAMSGYECHHGRSVLGPGAAPLAELELGTGNGTGDGDDLDAGPDGTTPAPTTDGAVHGRVVGTYVHGPVLARNAELADLLLGWAMGGATLEAAPSDLSARLRGQRIAEDRADPTGWGGRVHGNPRLSLGRLLRRR